MFRFTATFDFQVSDEDVLVGQLTALAKRTGEDLLPALAQTIQRLRYGGNALGVSVDQGILYLTRDLQGVPYWTDDEPVAWVEGLIVAKWVLLYDHGGEVDRL